MSRVTEEIMNQKARSVDSEFLIKTVDKSEVTEGGLFRVYFCLVFSFLVFSATLGSVQDTYGRFVFFLLPSSRRAGEGSRSPTLSVADHR